ncbi:hypothetical protein OIU77_022144 [Salix suchowensis]|uniref:Uncharacterized protein n=1 Tax=Salix suchowensis TaxID=1278906 RepID=A0ABQ8ZGV3_9ROSI|nr:hypothetical protein OIU77_022144 [Salix suchowensis]
MAQKSTVSDLWSCCLDYLRIRGAVLGWTTDTAAARRRSNLSGLACFATTVAGGNSLMVEHSLAKAEVEGSSPSFRSWLRRLVITSGVGSSAEAPFL